MRTIHSTRAQLLDSASTSSSHLRLQISGFFSRLENLRKLIKEQDSVFNSLPNDGMFAVKASIHRKNSQLWTQQTLELTMEFLGNLTTVDAITAPHAGRYAAEHQASVAEQKALPFGHVSDQSDDEDD